MKKKTVTILSSAIALSMVATSAYAAPSEKSKGKANGNAEIEITVQADSDTTVTDSVYGGSKGLQNAYENVKDKPAGERIAFLLLSKYNIEINSDADLTAVVDNLEAEGELEAAADAQAEIVLDNISDINQYKKLSKLQEKLGKKGIKAYVNGKEPQFDVPPVMVKGRTLVPFRAIAEALDAEVKWDAATKTVIVTRGATEVKLTLGSDTYLVNGEEFTLDVPAHMKGNRVLVPLRILSEALQAEVKWDSETSSVIVIDVKKSAQE
ncbi:copper amine oxidase N-terminal domain-containing protein [Paenibacillus tarimensis]